MGEEEKGITFEMYIHKISNKNKNKNKQKNHIKRVMGQSISSLELVLSQDGKKYG